MRKSWQSHPLGRRIGAVFLLLVILPVLVLLFFLNTYTRQQFERYQISTTQEQILSRATNLQTALDSIEYALLQLSVDKNVKNLIQDYSSGVMTGETYEARKSIMETSAQLEFSIGSAWTAISFTSLDKLITHYGPLNKALTMTPLTEQEWFSTTLNARGKVFWSGIETLNSSQAISASRVVMAPTTFKTIGAVYISVNCSNLFDTTSSEDETVFYHNVKTGEIFTDASASTYHSTIQALLNGAKDVSSTAGAMDFEYGGNSYVLVYSTPNSYGWQAACSFPQNEYFSSITKFSMLAMAAILVLLTLLMLFIIHMFSKFVHPMQNLIDYVNHNTGENVVIKQDKHGYPEIQRLEQKMISLEKSNTTVREELSKVSSENEHNKLKYLQMQLNPHFLYNTLNSIKILAETDRVKDVSSVITDLTHLLTSCIDKNGSIVTVAQELSTLKCYFNIQSTIYEGGTNFVLNVNPDLDEYLVPNFILQPLVENALIHGIDRSRKENTIWVSDRAQGEKLIFEVRDNGSGIPAETIRQIQSEFQQPNSSHGIGLTSVNQRIRLRYGDEYGLKIDSRVGEGTTISVELPLVWDDTSEF